MYEMCIRDRVKVDMGEPHLAPEEIPIAMENKDVGKVIDEEIYVDGRKYLSLIHIYQYRSFACPP